MPVELFCLRLDPGASPGGPSTPTNVPSPGRRIKVALMFSLISQELGWVGEWNLISLLNNANIGGESEWSFMISIIMQNIMLIQYFIT